MRGRVLIGVVFVKVDVVRGVGVVSRRHAKVVAWWEVGVEKMVREE